MSDRGDAPEPNDEAERDGETAGPSKAEDWRCRRRLAEVFGDVLPETTSDERDAGSEPKGDRESASDQWLRSQVPPHHGG